MGEIQKVWRGCCRESIHDHDKFRIEFPANCDVETKSILLGVPILMVTLLNIKSLKGHLQTTWTNEGEEGLLKNHNTQ